MKLSNNKEVLKYNLWDYNDAYNLVSGNITIVGDNTTQVSLVNCAAFIKCIKKLMEQQ